MTSFNAPSVLMPLDEYYDRYVNPKPQIPESYPGYSGRKQRQAAHLQSYRDDSDDDKEDDDDDEEEQQQVDDSSVDESNLEFETNECYNDNDDTMGQDQAEAPPTSTQWRIHPNNVNRPPGAAPLVPNNADGKSKMQQQGSFFNRPGHGRFKKQTNYKNYTNNNCNNSRISVHHRLGNNWQRRQQRNRNFVNSINKNQMRNVNMNDNKNNNNNKPQQQVLMKLNTRFPYGQKQIKVTADLNPIESPGSYLNGHSYKLNGYPSQNRFSSNSVTSMTKSANLVQSNSRDVINNNNINDNNQARKFNLNNNQVENHLWPVASATSTNDSPVVNTNNGQLQPRLINQSSQLQSLTANSGTGSLVASDSLHLIDLQNNAQKLNIIELAKNAVLILRQVFHMPSLNEDVQQELSYLQRNNGLPKEPTGLDMEIHPQVTDMRMHKRFQ